MPPLRWASIRRVVVIDDGSGLLELINPEILETSKETQIDAEGCLSNPGQYGMVERPYRVKVRAQDRSGNWFEKEGEGPSGPGPSATSWTIWRVSSLPAAPAGCSRVDELQG